LQSAVSSLQPHLPQRNVAIASTPRTNEIPRAFPSTRPWLDGSGQAFRLLTTRAGLCSRLLSARAGKLGPLVRVAGVRPSSAPMHDGQALLLRSFLPIRPNVCSDDSAGGTLHAPGIGTHRRCRRSPRISVVGPTRKPRPSAGESADRGEPDAPCNRLGAQSLRFRVTDFGGFAGYAWLG
jgi:hypothetical protein